jgi:hybrid cluster-associated redox disulfide protein
MPKNKPYVLKKDVLISDILRDCPKAAELLIEYGLFCFTCPLNQSETLEQGAAVHQMTKKQIEKMVKEVNIKLEKFYEKTNH